MSWNVTPKKKENTLFLRLEDKESFDGVFLGDPKTYYVNWDVKPVAVVPEEHPNASFRFKINVAVKQAGKWVPKIFEQGEPVFNKLVKIKSLGHKLDQKIINVEMNKVSPKKTEYTLTVTGHELTQDDVNQLGLLNLNSL